MKNQVNAISRITTVELVEQIKAAYIDDPKCVTIQKDLETKDNLKLDLPFKLKDGLIYKDEDIYIPNEYQDQNYE